MNIILLSALAYIGPGLGAGAVAAALGVIGAFFLSIFTFIFYPIKRLLKKRKKNSPSLDDTAVNKDR